MIAELTKRKLGQKKSFARLSISNQTHEKHSQQWQVDGLTVVTER